jgi:hypothetical protein
MGLPVGVMACRGGLFTCSPTSAQSLAGNSHLRDARILRGLAGFAGNRRQKAGQTRLLAHASERKAWRLPFEANVALQSQADALVAQAGS